MAPKNHIHNNAPVPMPLTSFALRDSCIEAAQGDRMDAGCSKTQPYEAEVPNAMRCDAMNSKCTNNNIRGLVQPFSIP